MGPVNVIVDGNEELGFRMKSTTFNALRSHLVQSVGGPRALQEYDIHMFQRREDPLLHRGLQFIKLKETRKKPVDPRVKTALTIIAYHADDCGSFNHKECKELLWLFDKYKRGFKRSKKTTPELNNIFDRFHLAFRFVVDEPNASIQLC